MNLSTNPFFNHAIDQLCIICHVILRDTDSTAHSIFSTSEELESPMNVLQVLQSFSNFNFYNGTQMICTTCHNKTIDVYKFIQMCNKAHENMQHYLKYLDTIKAIKDETDVDVKVEEISTAPTTILIDGQECVEETENEIISKFDELGMIISGKEIKIEEKTLTEGLEKEEIKAIKDQTDVDVKVEEISIAPTGIIIDGQEFVEKTENEIINKFDELGVIISGTQIKIEERTLKEGMEKEETGNYHITTSHTKIVTEEKTDSSDFDNLNVEIIDEQLHDERMGLNISNLHAHFHVHTDEKKFTCLICKRGFVTPSTLRRHVDSHNGVKGHKCEQCNRSFTQAANLRRHMDIHNAVKAHQCEQCDRRFTQAAHLRRHMDSHNGVKAHKCEQCDRRFSQAAYLRSHMGIHNGVQAHKCEQCDRPFTQASDLRRHMQIHNGVKAHKCELCDRRFIRAAQLRNHMNTHNGIRAHKCEHCDRRFNLASDLRRHMDIHNGVKVHKCEQCDRAFTQASDLRRHVDIHNGVKAHQCEQCDRRFNLASDLRRHMDIHNGVKAHQCEQCGLRFNLASNLRRHMDIHNGAKAHKCEQCDRRFTRASNLRTHMMIHNRIVIQM